MTKKVIVAIVALASTLTVTAQNAKRPESYNYQRGLEALQEEKRQEAIDYFNKDLQENSKNGYFLFLDSHASKSERILWTGIDSCRHGNKVSAQEEC